MSMQQYRVSVINRCLKECEKKLKEQVDAPEKFVSVDGNLRFYRGERKIESIVGENLVGEFQRKCKSYKPPGGYMKSNKENSI